MNEEENLSIINDIIFIFKTSYLWILILWKIKCKRFLCKIYQSNIGYKIIFGKFFKKCCIKLF